MSSRYLIEHQSQEGTSTYLVVERESEHVVARCDTKHDADIVRVSLEVAVLQNARMEERYSAYMSGLVPAEEVRLQEQET